MVTLVESRRATRVQPSFDDGRDLGPSAHFGVGLWLGRTDKVRRAHPDHAHAHRSGARDVSFRPIADNGRLRGGGSDRRQGALEDSRMRLADAGVVRGHVGVETIAEAELLLVSAAVGVIAPQRVGTDDHPHAAGADAMHRLACTIGQLDHLAQRRGAAQARQMRSTSSADAATPCSASVAVTSSAVRCSQPGASASVQRYLASGANHGRSAERFPQPGDHQRLVWVALEPAGIVDQRSADIDQQRLERLRCQAPILPDRPSARRVRGATVQSWA